MFCRLNPSGLPLPTMINPVASLQDVMHDLVLGFVPGEFLIDTSIAYFHRGVHILFASKLAGRYARVNSLKKRRQVSGWLEAC
jgi:hypothetical protein